MHRKKHKAFNRYGTLASKPYEKLIPKKLAQKIDKSEEIKIEDVLESSEGIAEELREESDVSESQDHQLLRNSKETTAVKDDDIEAIELPRLESISNSKQWSMDAAMKSRVKINPLFTNR